MQQKHEKQENFFSRSIGTEQNRSGKMFVWIRKTKQQKIVGMPCICDKNGNITVTLENKMEDWKKYKEKLLNEENECSEDLNTEKK